jgi:ubiquinone/menaquinone biosynthesis C-methylase UbiE
VNDTAGTTGYVYPASHAGWLSSPLRRLAQHPQRILRGLVGEGDTVIDLGCGPGYFSLDLARMVGEGGTVIAVDLQQAMLEKLRRRAERAGLASRIRLHRCAADALDLNVEADFALAFYMLHEVPQPQAFLGQVSGILKPGGKLLLVEPSMHVSSAHFQRSLELAAKAGLRAVSEPRLALSRARLLERVWTGGGRGARGTSCIAWSHRSAEDLARATAVLRFGVGVARGPRRA